MEKTDPYAEWVLFATKLDPGEPPLAADEELVSAARTAWPHVLAHVRHRLLDKELGRERRALAAEIWDRVLVSVAKTRLRNKDLRSPIMDLESYLIGVFHHRFNRALKKDRLRREILRSLPPNGDFGPLSQAHHSEVHRVLDQSLQVQEAVGRMDEWTRKVWAARQYGYSWREIAEHFNLTEPQAKLRFRYAIGKLRAFFGPGR